MTATQLFGALCGIGLVLMLIGLVGSITSGSDSEDRILNALFVAGIVLAVLSGCAMLLAHVAG